MKEVSAIDIVDPNPKALELGKSRLTQLPNANLNIEFQWQTSLKNAECNGDLCIVATQASNRFNVIRDIVNKLGYSKFIIEKVVTQSVSEYEKIIDLSIRKDLSIWVNCKSRAYPFHKLSQESINPDDKIVLQISGGNQGLATNGIHGTDLFLFYDRSEEIHLLESRIDQNLHKSKRGDRLFDLSGTLTGYTDKGSILNISYSQFSQIPDQMVMTSPRYRYIVDHMQQWAYTSALESNWNWTHADLSGNFLISNMTKEFAHSILSTNSCSLPTLKQCFPAHKFILNSLLPHFNLLLDEDSSVCPIT